MPQSRSNEAKPKAVLRSKSISMARNSSAEALFEPHQDKIAVANASDVVRFGESPKFPGVIIAYRTDRARMANPERLNLDRRNLSVSWHRLLQRYHLIEYTGLSITRRRTSIAVIKPTKQSYQQHRQLLRFAKFNFSRSVQQSDTSTW